LVPKAREKAHSDLTLFKNTLGKSKFPDDLPLLSVLDRLGSKPVGLSLLGISNTIEGERMKYVYLFLAFVGIGLGALAAVIPLLPSFPFLLLAFICFGKSSEKLDRWFKNTKLYKNNLESYINKQGMTRGNKIRVMLTVTTVMIFGFVMLRQILIGQIILGIVWIGHILYFAFGVKEKALNTTQHQSCERTIGDNQIG